MCGRASEVDMVFVLNSLGWLNATTNTRVSQQATQPSLSERLAHLNNKFTSTALAVKAKSYAVLSSTNNVEHTTQHDLMRHIASLNSAYSAHVQRQQARPTVGLIITADADKHSSIADHLNELNTTYKQTRHQSVKSLRSLRPTPIVPVHQRPHLAVIKALNTMFSQTSARQHRLASVALPTAPPRAAHDFKHVDKMASLNSVFTTLSANAHKYASRLPASSHDDSSAAPSSSALALQLADLNAAFVSQQQIAKTHTSVALSASPAIIANTAENAKQSLVHALQYLNHSYKTQTLVARSGAVPLTGAEPELAFGPRLKWLSELNDRYAAVALQAHLRGETNLAINTPAKLPLALLDLGMMTDLEQLAPHFAFYQLRPLSNRLLEEPVMRALLIMDKIGHGNNIQRLEAKSLTSPLRQLKPAPTGSMEMLSTFSLDEDMSRDTNKVDDWSESQTAADMDSHMSSRTKLLLQAYKRAPTRLMVQC